MKPITNPPNPFSAHDCDYFEGMAPPAQLRVYEDKTRNILSRNDSPNLGFRWSLNPYRGCQHACTYCYARPSHEYLGFGAGTDFETRIVIKPEAPRLLRETFKKRSWKGELILFSGDTDCYQPLEHVYRLTRGCLEACLEFGNPAAIITKSFLVTRDIDLFKSLHERTHFSVTLSIPFLDERKCRLVEPHAASAAKRFEAVEKLAKAGIDVGVNIAPVIPGLNDPEIPGILRRAREMGAQWAAMIPLRLPGSVRDVFLQRLERDFPMALGKIVSRIREMRGGKLYRSDFGSRFQGEGVYWDQVQKSFDLHCSRLGLNAEKEEKPRLPFRRPEAQFDLFAGA